MVNTMASLATLLLMVCLARGLSAAVPLATACATILDQDRATACKACTTEACTVCTASPQVADPWTCTQAAATTATNRRSVQQTCTVASQCQTSAFTQYHTCNKGVCGCPLMTHTICGVGSLSKCLPQGCCGITCQLPGQVCVTDGSKTNALGWRFPKCVAPTEIPPPPPPGTTAARPPSPPPSPPGVVCGGADFTSDKNNCGACGTMCTHTIPPVLSNFREYYVCEDSKCVCPSATHQICGAGSRMKCLPLGCCGNNCATRNRGAAPICATDGTSVNSQGWRFFKCVTAASVSPPPVSPPPLYLHRSPPVSFSPPSPPPHPPSPPPRPPSPPATVPNSVPSCLAVFSLVKLPMHWGWSGPQTVNVCCALVCKNNFYTNTAPLGLKYAGICSKDISNDYGIPLVACPNNTAF